MKDSCSCLVSRNTHLSNCFDFLVVVLSWMGGAGDNDEIGL